MIRNVCVHTHTHARAGGAREAFGPPPATIPPVGTFMLRQIYVLIEIRKKARVSF